MTGVGRGPGGLTIDIPGGRVRVHYGEEMVQLTLTSDGHRGITLALTRDEVDEIAAALQAWLKRRRPHPT